LIPNLSRGRDRSIGDLDVGEKGSELTIVTLQLLHHGSIGYMHVRTQVSFAKNANFLHMQSRTQTRIRKNATELQMNDYI
jgi:hypothetical protein